MSLINEALKKAQRQRNEGPVDLTDSGSGGGGRIAKHAPARSAKTMILLAGGAAVLVVVSVVLTFFLVNRPKPQTPPAVAAIAPTLPKPEEKSPGPLVLPPPSVAPVVQMPIAQTPVATPPQTLPPIAPASAIPPLVSTALPPSSAPAVPVAAPPPIAVQPTPAPAPAKPAAPAIDERVHAYVEALRISGVKAAGTESRVLMNDRFFRINDVVDRTLGVKLIKVEADKLTFADANGVAYVKFY